MTDDAALFDVDSVRRLESVARAASAGGALMERAGQAAWRVLLDTWPHARRLLVVCGGGGNGGDGYVLARHAHLSGLEVVAVSPDGRPPADADAQAAWAAFTGAGGRTVAFAGELPAADVLVDALVGIGLKGPLTGPAMAIVEAMRAHPAPVLSLDVPSGVDRAGGYDAVVRADVTIEFLLPKLMLRTGPAVEVCGQLRLATLDVPEALSGDVVPSAMALRPPMLGRWLRPRGRDSHKGRNGRVLCVGGEAGSGGAILMCAEAALRCGAGLVRVHTREEHVAALLARLPEAMASTTVADFAWPDAIAIGPGMGTSGWARDLWAQALASGTPIVVDADALNLLATAPRILGEDAILTPHPGEAARLLRIEVAAVQRDRLGALHALVERFGCAVVLKGAGTLVGAPGRTPALVDAGGPALASGGTGDVLTGVIAALRAQGLDAFDAACCAALLHAAAGDAAGADGARGLRATDLMPHLRRLANP